MADLRCQYLGLDLRSPIILASSDLSNSVDNLCRAEESGAGAVVLKSIFEEQFLIEGGLDFLEKTVYPEAKDYLQSRGLLAYAPAERLKLIEEGKKKISIPIIASLNCQSPEVWPLFARQLADAGADALELNIYYFPLDKDISSQEIEKRMEQVVSSCYQAVSIPLAVKLPYQLTALPNLAYRLQQAGAKGLVFFNWFLETEINLSKRKIYYFRGHGQFPQVLRWIGLLAGRVDCDLAASGGVMTTEAALKLLLAGAKAVQVCRLVYERGFSAIRSLIDGLERWMINEGYRRLDELIGELSWKELSLSLPNEKAASNYFRLQYMKVYTGSQTARRKSDS
ncbi:MAG: dihydroorotate dehydrogenase-like protein, partial [Candidatus Aminicenantes bacterium]|nr:dihydroorotate dehydrogenase-like protein [Candidatus Aminicenantes bacterium]